MATNACHLHEASYLLTHSLTHTLCIHYQSSSEETQMSGDSENTMQRDMLGKSISPMYVL
eukprot:Clim_evm6s147 gene=Clim_evmTU6s147